MKKIFFFLVSFLIANAGIAQTQPACETFIKFANETEVILKVTIYNRTPDDPDAKIIKTLTIKSKENGKIPATAEKTYYYIAEEVSDGDADMGEATAVRKGKIEAQECKTMKKTFQ